MPASNGQDTVAPLAACTARATSRTLCGVAGEAPWKKRRKAGIAALQEEKGLRLRAGRNGANRHLFHAAIKIAVWAVTQIDFAISRDKPESDSTSGGE